MRSILTALAATQALLMAAPSSGADTASSAFDKPRNVGARTGSKAEKLMMPPPENKAMKKSPKSVDADGRKATVYHRGDPCAVDSGLPGCVTATIR